MASTQTPISTSINPILIWLQLEFIVTSLLSRNSKIILKGINGFIELNTLTALMGSSGAGKSTLLKCLSGINREGMTPTSRIEFMATNHMNMCFIFQNQNNYLHQLLTVRQSLIYSSKLKNSEQNIRIDHNINVDDLIEEFLLYDIRDNKIKDCSGGELKRLSIAQELTSIKKPTLMFMDEPTTGLDSNASDIVIRCLYKLTRKYKMSIFASIHQPNSDLLEMFDKIYVLSKGGHCLYFGSPTHLSGYLSESQINCNPNEVPIEVLLKLSAIGSRDKQITDLIERNSKLIQLSNEEKAKENTFSMTSKSFKIKDIYYLFMRRFQINFIIQWKTLLIETVFHLLFVFLITESIDQNYWKIDGCFHSFSLNSTNNRFAYCLEKERDKRVIEQNIYLLYVTSFVFMLTIISITTKNLTADVDSVSTELKNHWFSTFSYFCSKSIIDCIPVIVNSFLQSLVICYYTEKVDNFYRFLYYNIIFTTGMLCSQSFGTIVGLIFTGNQLLAVMVSMSSYIVLTFFNNFIIPTKELVWIFQIFSDFTFPKHVFNSILIVFYGLNRCEANNGSRVLYEYGIVDNDLYFSIICSLIILVFFKHCELILFIIKTNWQRIKMDLAKLFKDNLFQNNLKKISENVLMNSTLLKNNVINLPEKDEFFEVKTESILGSDNTLKNKVMIAWIDLTFSLKKKRGEKVILQNLNGFFDFHSLNAVMGPSGVGKTTFLKCLIGQNNWGISEHSKIYLSNIEEIRPCFIKQNVSDHLVLGLTVSQTLIYASKLKNSEINEEIDHKLIANQLMEELLISDIRETNTCNCSGGELKRLVIASELMATNKPNMLCIDEPTSGLDSNAAHVIITCLKSLTRIHKMSIIATIHQPNNELFQKFDNIYILAKGGTHIYSGRPQDLKDYLKASNVCNNESQYPIEAILKIGSNGLNENIKELSKINSQKKSLFLNLKHEVHQTINGLTLRNKSFKLIDFWNLLVRNMIYSYVYEWKSLIIQIVLYILLAINLSNLYKREISLIDGCIDKFVTSSLCNVTEESLRKESQLKQNIQYNLSFITGTSFIQIIITTITFTSKVNVFLSEHRNCWYSTGAYFWSKSVVDAIPILFALMIFSEIINYYQSVDMYFSYLYCLSLSVLCAQSFGHLSGILFRKNTTIAVFVSVTFYLISSNLSNIFIPLEDFHYLFKTISNLSFLKHSINYILLKIYGFGRCSEDKFSIVLYKYDINEDIYVESILNLIFILILIKFLTLFILVMKTNTNFSNKIRNKNNQDQSVKIINTLDLI